MWNGHTALVAAILASVLVIGGCAETGSTQSIVDDSGAYIAAEAEASDDGSDSGIEAINDTETTDSDETGAVTAQNQESHFDTDDLEYDESEVVEITLNGTSATAESGAVTVDGSTVTITAEGTYSLSGTLSDGGVIVDAADAEDVILLLNGANITNSDGAAVAVMNADDAVVLLADGSTNLLADGAGTFTDTDTDEPNATLYSATDLTIAGEGELIVDAGYNDGITSKDGLVIESGSIEVAATDDGIRGKDYIIIDGGTIAVEAGGDGLKADNEEDADRGYVMITDGVLDITSGDDGVQGATDVLVTGGRLTIDAGSGSGSGRAIEGDVMVVVSDGVIDATAADDAIHSNNEITIDGGVLTLASGDDGIHGDYSVTINSGSITITEAFEGIESEVITINDGLIDITSNDDGLNVASAEATTNNTGRGGDAVGDHYIDINGGTTVITITGDLAEQGDGIDANGHVEMTGGVVVVSGPTDTRNSAVDFSGGTFVMSGGMFIGTNIDGRNSEGVGSGSTQASMYLSSGSTISAGTVVHIESTEGKSLVTFEPVNAYNVIVFSSPDLIDGQSYDVYLGGAVTGDSATNLYEESAYTTGDLAGTVTAGLS